MFAPYQLEQSPREPPHDDAREFQMALAEFVVAVIGPHLRGLTLAEAAMVMRATTAALEGKNQ